MLTYFLYFFFSSTSCSSSTSFLLLLLFLLRVLLLLLFLLLLLIFFFFFFSFHSHYSPLCALACRTMSFHFFLSATNSLHLLTRSTWNLFLLPLSIFSWVFPFFPSLPVLEWRSFWPSYPPPFSLGDLTSLFFALLSTLLYFLLYSSRLVLDSSDFSIARFHI